MADRPSLPLVAVSSAWAMAKAKVSMPSTRADEDTLAFNIKMTK
jgi:peptide/nickel transport system substrate-binding protein